MRLTLPILALTSTYAFGAVLIGNDPTTSRSSNSDGATGVFYTSFIPMPDDGTVDSIALRFQGSGSTFELIQLRPTGTADQFNVVYRSATITPSGTNGTVSTIGLPGGSVSVEAGDVFAHFGRGIPYSSAPLSLGGNQQPNFVPIFFSLGAGANIPLAGDGETITINTTSGSSSIGDNTFPIRTDLTRDYAYSVNFTAVPEPSGMLFAGLAGLSLGLRRRR